MDPALLFAYALVTLLALVNGAVGAFVFVARRDDQKHRTEAAHALEDLRQHVADHLELTKTEVMAKADGGKSLLEAVAAEHNKLARQLAGIEEWKAGVATQAMTGQRPAAFQNRAGAR